MAGVCGGVGVSKAFISYVREDQKVVDYLADVLRSNGIEVWVDRDELIPGTRWRDSIEKAIRGGTFFLSVFSRARSSRSQSYVHEETLVAIEELRRMPQDRKWFIPVKIDDCEVEERRIGPGESLRDLQLADLRNWRIGIERLLASMGVTNPQLENGDPIADGIPPSLEVTGGFIRYDRIEDAPEVFQGMEHRVVSGWCRRNEKSEIIAYFELYAPLKQFQDFNRLLGYTGFHAFSPDRKISTSPDVLSSFVYRRRLIAPAGTPVPNLQGAGMLSLPIDLELVTSFVANGHILEGVFCGTFQAMIEFDQFGQKVRSASSGIFEMQLRY